MVFYDAKRFSRIKENEIKKQDYLKKCETIRTTTRRQPNQTPKSLRL